MLIVESFTYLDFQVGTLTKKKVREKNSSELISDYTSQKNF